MTAIHQLVHTLSYGDAISGEVLAIQRILRAKGCKSEIFAIHIHPAHKEHAKDFSELDTSFVGQVLLHYSLGSPLNELYRSLNRAKRSLIYHNLTPAHWFKGVNPRIVRDIEQGLLELPELLRLSNQIIADSAFNASELASLNFKSTVLPLPIDSAKWDIDTNHGIAKIVQSDPGIHLLHVGRLAPNKCVEDIIKIFHFVHNKLDASSRLWLVGIDIDTEIYSFSLKHLADQLNLTHAINFVGCMADSEVKALYENCSCYLCMSEHEGFCLPVIEAMHFGLPVVAYNSSALPDTVGNGGIIVKEKRHAEIAELVVEICNQPELRTRLVNAGKARAGELSLEKFESDLLNCVLAV